MTTLTITRPGPTGGQAQRTYQLAGDLPAADHLDFLESLWAASHLQGHAKAPLDWLWRAVKPLPGTGGGIGPGDHVSIDGADYWATDHGWTTNPAHSLRHAPRAGTAKTRQQSRPAPAPAAGPGVARHWHQATRLQEVHRSQSWRAEFDSFADYLRDAGISTSRAYQLLNYADLTQQVHRLCPATRPDRLLTEPQARDLWPQRATFLHEVGLRLADASLSVAEQHRIVHDIAELLRSSDPLLGPPDHIGLNAAPRIAPRR